MTRSCPLCSSDAVSFFLRKGTMDLCHCSRCDVVFQDLSGGAPRSEDLYGASYYEAWGMDENGISSFARVVKESTFREKLRRIDAYCPPGRILDIGCAQGAFLELALAAGWDPWGIEINPLAVRLARRKLGDRIIEGSIDLLGAGAPPFDAVTLFDVLEHFPDPLAELARIRARIKEGGWLFLVVPDWRSIYVTLFRSQWVNFKYEHLYYFSRRSITAVLEQAGFETVSLGLNRKMLNLSYAAGQFRAFGFGMIGTAVSALHSLLPEKLRQYPFPVPTDELFVVARKKTA